MIERDKEACIDEELDDLRGQVARLREENARLVAMAEERAIRVDDRVELPPGCRTRRQHL